MFKIPKWEDVPKSDIAFGTTSKKKKKQDSSITHTAKTLIAQKGIKNKANNNFPQQKNNASHFKTKKKRKLNKKFDVNNQNSLNKPGQFVMNPNKRKIDDTFDKEDMEPSERKKRKKKKNTNNELTYNKTPVNMRIKNKLSMNSNESKINKKKYDNADKETEVTFNVVKINSKKEKLKKMLEVQINRNKIDVSGNSNNLRQRMLQKLKAAQFRYLNEKLYTSSGSEAKQLFQSDPDAFQTYHQGYQQQLKKWPVNPLDLIVKRILKMPKSFTIADMGCGEAALSMRVPQSVRSFDLVAGAPGVEVCDMARSPLLAGSLDVAVYCLALMGTDLTQYLLEANRILKTGGHLLIAEVESRFDKVDTFTEAVQKLGFKLKNLDSSHQVFFFMEFVKVREPPAKKSKLPDITLKPCLYKRR